MRFAICLLLFACGAAYHTPGYLPEDGNVSLYHIMGAEVYSNHMQWWGSPWHRPADKHDDGNYPKFVLLTSSGLGCIVPPDIWATNPEFLSGCASGWLMPRP